MNFVYVIVNQHGHVIQAKISRVEAIMVAVRANGLEFDEPEGKEMVKQTVKAFCEQRQFSRMDGSVKVGDYEIKYFAQ